MSDHMERIDELLADRALYGLDEAEQAELERAVHEASVEMEAELASWDAAAGAATTAMLGSRVASPPEHLMHKLQADALSHFAREGQVSLSEVAAALRKPEAEPPATTQLPDTPRRINWLTPLLAAAVLLVAVALIWRPGGETALDPAVQRQTLLSSGEVSVAKDWLAGPSPLRGSPTGDVVWSDTRQEGYMRLSGIPANFREQQQYQLWIVDTTRQNELVDGGVFDIPSGATEVVVPIDAKLPVRSAAEFVITLEKSGGVVVSGQDHVIAKTF